MAVVYSQYGTIVRTVEPDIPPFIMDFSKIKGVYQNNGYNVSYSSGLAYDTANNICKIKFTMTGLPDGRTFYLLSDGRRQNFSISVAKVPNQNAISIFGVNVPIKYNVPYEIQLDGTTLTIDGTEHTVSYTAWSDSEWYIGPSYSTTSYTCNIAYLEYITIIDKATGKVLFDKQAASRNKDNQVGLLDTVTGSFFTLYLGGVR